MIATEAALSRKTFAFQNERVLPESYHWYIPFGKVTRQTILA